MLVLVILRHSIRLKFVRRAFDCSSLHKKCSGSSNEFDVDLLSSLKLNANVVRFWQCGSESSTWLSVKLVSLTSNALKSGIRLVALTNESAGKQVHPVTSNCRMFCSERCLVKFDKTAVVSRWHLGKMNDLFLGQSVSLEIDRIHFLKISFTFCVECVACKDETISGCRAPEKVDPSGPKSRKC